MQGCLDRPGGPPPTRVSGGRGRAELPRDPDLLPELPLAYERALDRGLDVLGLTLGGEARVAIARHVRLLLAWNGAINLTAITDPEAVATRHVVDSLAAARFLGGRLSLFDLGSGGGFPGLPLVAALPSARVTLVESVAKKAAFLETAVTGAGLSDRASVLAARAEAIAASHSRGPGWDVVLARGVADLAELIELAMPLLARGGRLVAWKRGDLTSELEAAANAAAALGAAEPSVRPAAPGGPKRLIPGLENHVLVEVRKVRPTPSGFPRDRAARRRHRW